MRGPAEPHDHTAEKHNAQRVTVHDGREAKQVLPTTMTHLDQFIQWGCSAELLRMKLFPNAQEITESVGCLAAADKELGDELRFGASDVTCVVVGDGSRPRTAALACCRTKWRRVISIDPALRTHDATAMEEWKALERLELRKAKIEETTIDVDPALDSAVVIILPHAHIPPNKAIGALRLPAAVEAPTLRIVVVQLPCCDYEWHDRCVGVAPDVIYEDIAMASSRRLVRVWRDVFPAAWANDAVGKGAAAPQVRTDYPVSCSINRARGWRRQLPDRQSSTALVDAASWEGVKLVLCGGAPAHDASRRVLRKRQYAKAFGDPERRVVSGRILKVPMLQARLLHEVSCQDPVVAAAFPDGPPDSVPPVYPEDVARKLLDLHIAQTADEGGTADDPAAVALKASLPVGGEGAVATRAFATTFSVPRWLVEVMLREVGAAGAFEYFSLLNSPADVALRVNFHRDAALTRGVVAASLLEDGITASPHPFVPTALVIARDDGKANIKASRMWREGYVEVQDTGSQLIAAAALPGCVYEGLQALDRAQAGNAEHDPPAKRHKMEPAAADLPPSTAPLRILDYCCGLGGKTLQFASLCGRPGVGTRGCAITAADIDADALRELPTRLKRCRLSDCVTARLHPLRKGDGEEGGDGQDGAKPLNWGAGQHAQGRKNVALGAAPCSDDRELYDLVFVDAPCSGLGRLRRRTDNRWRLPPSDLETYPAVQLDILCKAASHVAAGGTLCYATCSINSKENQGVVAAFNASPAGTGFRPDPLASAWGADVAAALGVGGDHAVTLYPHKHATDGFFIARWVRAA
eukprot:TRINITY_DN16040_c0_g1_i1.p1 TRINITY_DN16040_c0_g1~~TRINITY_DN16040_c0_g1_i1.p1  ORF type:complete len:810 (+),score=222.18 TRINITY_DN16040_c0_g1_i1:64-2493(+)